MKAVIASMEHATSAKKEPAMRRLTYCAKLSMPVQTNRLISDYERLSLFDMESDPGKDRARAAGNPGATTRSYALAKKQQWVDCYVRFPAA
jgi:hypothetical protein